MTETVAMTTARQTFDIEQFTFSPTELSPVDEGFDVDQWQRLGEFIRLTNQACAWWWGDWLNMGEEKFGEVASQALEATRWDEETLRVYAWVCRSVPRSSRVPGVSFAHYRCLAPLPEAEQHEWATRVVDDQWSVRQLKLALRKTPTDTQPCVLIRCKSEADADTVEALLPGNVQEICEVERITRARRSA